MRSARITAIRLKLTLADQSTIDYVRLSPLRSALTSADGRSLRSLLCVVRHSFMAVSLTDSATGGNGFARDVLAGIAAFYSTPLCASHLRHDR